MWWPPLDHRGRAPYQDVGHNRVDLLIGSNKDEGTFVSLYPASPLFGLEKTTGRQFTDGAGLPVWPVLEPHANERLILGPKIEVGPGLDSTRAALFDAVAIRRSAGAGARSLRSARTPESIHLAGL
jgi:hypothetical protein